MNRLLTFMFVLFGLLAASVPGAARASEVTQFTGGVLSANFSSLDPSDPSGCVGNAVSFFALGGKQGPGNSEAIAWISLAIARYNTCTGETLVEAHGFHRGTDLAIHVTKQLNTASLQGTVDVTDVGSGKTSPVTLDMHWTGVGSTAYIRQHTQIKKPGLLLNSNSGMAVRGADATGTVMAPWGQATPAPAYMAELRWINSATLTLDK